MRGGRRLTLILGTLGCLVASMGASSPGATASSPSPSPSPSSAAKSAADQLRARRAQLVLQLAQLEGPRSAAQAGLLGVEGRLGDAQARLADLRASLDAKDAELKGLSAQISSDQKTLEAAKLQLAALVRTTYEASDKDGFAGAILSADSFSQAVDRMHNAEQVTEQLQRLQQVIADKETSLLAERTRVQADFGAAQQLESQLSDESNRLLMEVGNRDVVFRQLDGPARQIAAEIARIDDQLAPPVAAAAPVNGDAPCGNRFAYGNCTYYVATRRCIPWLGNAWEWWNNARAYGYNEGQAPARGAVVVWGRGGGASWYGHVAYVEAVGPDQGIPAGSFLISEMNYAGWNRIDQRVVSDHAPGILGFIYGHS